MSKNLTESIKQVAKSLKMFSKDRVINSNFKVNNPRFDSECDVKKKKTKN